MAMNDINLVLEDILNGRDDRMLHMVSEAVGMRKPRMSKKATALDAMKIAINALEDFADMSSDSRDLEAEAELAMILATKLKRSHTILLKKHNGR